MRQTERDPRKADCVPHPLVATKLVATKANSTPKTISGAHVDLISNPDHEVEAHLVSLPIANVVTDSAANHEQLVPMAATAPGEAPPAEMLGAQYNSPEQLARIWTQRQWSSLALAILFVGALFVGGTSEKRRAANAMAAVQGANQDRVYVAIG